MRFTPSAKATRIDTDILGAASKSAKRRGLAFAANRMFALRTAYLAAKTHISVFIRVTSLAMRIRALSVFPLSLLSAL
jgi:hypothetical protein